MKRSFIILLSLVLAVSFAFTTGCQKAKEQAVSVEEKAKEAAEEMKEKTEEAKEEMKEAAEGTAKEMKEGTEQKTAAPGYK